MRVLLIQTGFLGDCVLSTPVVSGIHRKHSSVELWMLTTEVAAPLFRFDPLIHRVVSFSKRGTDSGLSGLMRLAADLRSCAFDLVYVLHKSLRTAALLTLARFRETVGFANSSFPHVFDHAVEQPEGEHAVIRALSILGWDSSQPISRESLRLCAPPLKECCAAVRDLAGDPSPYIVLAPGSVWKTKRWHWEHYRTLAAELLGRGYRVAVTGSSAERGVCSAVAKHQMVTNLAGCLDLPDLLAAIKGAALLVCNDSVALHIGSAFRVPTVAVFCSTTPRFGFGPWENAAEVVEKELPCRPCGRHGHQRCPIGTEACMRGISPQHVLNTCLRLLERCHA